MTPFFISDEVLGPPDGYGPLHHDRGVAVETSIAEGVLIDSVYAANVREDWEGLSEFMEYLAKRKPEVLILTNVILNPLSRDEQVAYSHSNHQVLQAFKTDGNFSDPQLFIESFRHDPASDLVAQSCRKILQLIERGKTVLIERLRKLEGILEACPCPYYVVPGQFENVDLIRALVPGKLADRYITVRKVTEKGFQILGIGGLPVLSDLAPLVFQDREYIEGNSQADEWLREAIGDDVDITVSFSPIKYFTDQGEEPLVRNFISEFLPGRVVLTSQAFEDPEKSHFLTASGAELIRGGSFGKGGSTGKSRLFWELSLAKKGLDDKSLFELKNKKSFRII